MMSQVQEITRKLTLNGNINAALIRAILTEDVTSYAVLVESDADLQQLDRLGQNLIHYAIKVPNLAIINDLALILDVNHKDNFGVTPGHVLCKQAPPASETLIHSLMLRGFRFDIPDEQGVTATEYLLRQHESINEQGLMFFLNHFEEPVKFLDVLFNNQIYIDCTAATFFELAIKFNLDLSEYRYKDKTITDNFLEQRNFSDDEMYNWLIGTNQKGNPTLITEFLCDVEQLMYLSLVPQDEINTPDDQGNSVLGHLMEFSGDVNIILEALQAKGDPMHVEADKRFSFQRIIDNENLSYLEKIMVFDSLSESQVNVFETNPLGCSLIHYIPVQQNNRLLEYLASKQANINQPLNNQQTVVHILAMTDDSNFAVIALNSHSELDVNWDAVDIHQQTPLIVAAKYSKNNVLATLCELYHGKNISLNAQDLQGNSALHHALLNENFHAIVALASHEADFSVKNNLGQTGYDLLAQQESTVLEEVQSIWKINSHPKLKQLENLIALKEAQESFNSESFFAYIGSQRISEESFVGPSPLLAVEYLEEEILIYFLENDMDANCQDDSGNTPLHNVVFEERFELIEPLMKNGADPGIKNNDGHSVYDLLVMDNDQEMLQYLCSFKQINIDTDLCPQAKLVFFISALNFDKAAEMSDELNDLSFTINGLGLVEYAAAANSREMVQLLLNKGCPLHAANNRGRSALQNAVINGNKLLVKDLIKVGADVNYFDKTDKKCNPLTLATINEDEDIVDILLKEGAIPKASSRHIREPLELAVSLHLPGAAGSMIAAGADTNIEITEIALAGFQIIFYKTTLLAKAFDEKDFHTAKVLIEAGANVNNPLLFKDVVEKGDLQAVQMLVSYGLNLSRIQETIEVDDWLNEITRDNPEKRHQYIQIFNLLHNPKATLNALFGYCDNDQVSQAIDRLSKSKSYTTSKTDDSIPAHVRKHLEVYSKQYHGEFLSERAQLINWSRRFITAVREDDYPMVCSYIQSGINVATLDFNHCVLHEVKSPEMATLLIEAGFNSNAVNQFGFNALENIILNDALDPAIMNQIIEVVADSVDTSKKLAFNPMLPMSNLSLTVLNYAALIPDLELFKTLLERSDRNKVAMPLNQTATMQVLGSETVRIEQHDTLLSIINKVLKSLISYEGRYHLVGNELNELNDSLYTIEDFSELQEKIQVLTNIQQLLSEYVLHQETQPSISPHSYLSFRNTDANVTDLPDFIAPPQHGVKPE